MFNNIDQLEKEIADFRSNLTSSNEMLQLMKMITGAVAKQNTALHEQLNSLEKVVEKTPAIIKTDYESMLREFSAVRNMSVETLAKTEEAYNIFGEVFTESAETIKSLPKTVDDNNTELVKKALTKLLDIQNVYTNSLEKTCGEFRGVIEKTHSEFNTQAGECKTQMAQTQEVVKTATDDLQFKHDAFLQLVDSMNLGNIEHILNLCDEIKTRQDDEIRYRSEELENRKRELVNAQKEVNKAQQEIAKTEAENADKIRALYMLIDKHNKQLSMKILPLYAGVIAIAVLLVLLYLR
jgi:hypothetical protein